MSTGGFGRESVEHTVSNFVHSGIKHIELSGGIAGPETLNFLKQNKKNGCSFVLHNYFPAPLKDPFVLNLGSVSKMVRARSRDLIIEALHWSCELESNFYAIHAPFRLDPSIKNLGKGFNVEKLTDYKATIKLFCEEYYELRNLGKKYGVELSIENNVLSEIDFQAFGKNQPFIFTGDEREPFSSYLGDEVSFLMDYGHLKVSANSLKFDPMKVLKELTPKIKWCHLSDNNGLADLNEKFGNDAWFIKHLSTLSVPSTLEIYTNNVEELKNIRQKLAGVL